MGKTMQKEITARWSGAGVVELPSKKAATASTAIRRFFFAFRKILDEPNATQT
jgi:hypothetical protein